MVQQGQIDHLLQETGSIEPPSHVARQATLQDYEAAYERSMADPEGFWAGVAGRVGVVQTLGQGVPVGLPLLPMVPGG